MVNKKISDNPKLTYLLVDFLLLCLSFFLVLTPFAENSDFFFQKCIKSFSLFAFVWFFCGVSLRKFHSFRLKSFRNAFKSIFKANLLSLFFFIAYSLLNAPFSIPIKILISIFTLLFLFEFITTLIYFSFRYAANFERFDKAADIQKKSVVLKENKPLDKAAIERINLLIKQNSGESTLSNLQNKVDLSSSNTLVFHSASLFNIQSMPENRFDVIINLKKTNDIRGICQFLVAIHDKLPYMGTYVGCFRSKSNYKKEFLSRYPIGINYILYSLIFILKRIFPKWSFTREIYFWLTGGKKRILAKAEVFGRLYACGFEIKDEFKADGLVYFVAVKSKEPIRYEVINFGPIIKLNRVGKNKKLFKVYKFRTMHPYSEYLQPYIYEKNKLQEGGKFNRDIRITSIGGFMRKYWIDELPMFLNLLKGDMKLVGIRPLSKHYFSLYSKELQEKRTKVKPGLLPPFYADMPKTLDDIQNSEMKYLLECEKNGWFLTDLKYLWLIFVNIVFRKARSK